MKWVDLERYSACIVDAGVATMHNCDALFVGAGLQRLFPSSQPTQGLCTTRGKHSRNGWKRAKIERLRAVKANIDH
jgi:hypothetical protein